MDNYLEKVRQILLEAENELDSEEYSDLLFDINEIIEMIMY